MPIERRSLGLTGIDLPVIGAAASQPFNVFGKESQTDRARLVRRAIDRGIDFFTTSPAFGEAERILAAGLAGYRHRATVMVTIRDPNIATAYRQIDMSLHLFDGRVDLYLVEMRAASDDLLTSLARMRAAGEAVAIGIECQTLGSLREVAPRVLGEGIDTISLPATLLLHSETSDLIAAVVDRQCGVVCCVPDGLEAARGTQLDELKIDAGDHGLSSVADVLVKLAVSDPRIASVSVPVRRLRDLDRIEEIATSPALNASEIAALRAY